MDFKVILSPIFVSDLQEIVRTLANRAGSEVAARIGNELLDRALSLGRNPFIGQPVKRRPGARKVLRYSYLIYYDVDEGQRMVEILRGVARAPRPENVALGSSRSAFPSARDGVASSMWLKVAPVAFLL